MRPGFLRHRKLLKACRLLGRPRPHVVGYVHLIWESCYESGDPYIGSVEDVEMIAEWEGEPGVLCKALADCGSDGPGLIEKVKGKPGHYAVHDLWDHAPDYVRKRRAREHQRQDNGRQLATLDRTVTGQCLPSTDSQDGDGRTPAPAPAPAPKELKHAPPPAPPSAPPAVAVPEPGSWKARTPDQTKRVDAVWKRIERKYPKDFGRLRTIFYAWANGNPPFDVGINALISLADHDAESPPGYLMHIIKVEEPNAYEQRAIHEHNQRKKERPVSLGEIFGESLGRTTP